MSKRMSMDISTNYSS